MKKLSILLVAIFSVCMAFAQTNEAPKSKIQVLNVGTFHMGETSDANKTEFDEKDPKNQNEAHAIAEAIAAFQPTVIIVETPPKYNEKLRRLYAEYKTNPKMTFERPDEIELLAYEVGRLAGVDTDRIYGIDHKMGYNYGIGRQLKAKRPFTTYLEFMKKAEAILGGDFNSGSTFDKLNRMNQPEVLDFLININADILTHVSTEGKFEGADEAAKFYQRNLRMYSNLNQIELKEDDRVFILMGGTHTAFFKEFMERSPKYELVSVFDYLKEKI